MLELKNNKVYLNGQPLSKPALIYDSIAGLMKIGELKDLKDYYSIAQLSYGISGTNVMVEALNLVSLDALRPEDIITIYSYYLSHSSNGPEMKRLFNCDEATFRKKLNELKELL